MEEDPSAFAFDEVYDDMKHKDIVPKLQDRQHLKVNVKPLFFSVLVDILLLILVHGGDLKLVCRRKSMSG